MTQALRCRDESIPMDGFTADGSWLWQSAYLQPYAVAALDTLRRAAGFRPRYHVTPMSSQTPLAQFDVTFMSVRLPVGTVIWGLLFWDDAAAAAESVQIAETEGRELFSEPMFLGSPPQQQFYADNPEGVIYLMEPFTVAASGEINVSIANGATVPSSPVFPAQLVLLCAEPIGAEVSCP
jgi:hypothetical protein